MVRFFYLLVFSDIDFHWSILYVLNLFHCVQILYFHVWNYYLFAVQIKFINFQVLVVLKDKNILERSLLLTGISLTPSSAFLSDSANAGGSVYYLPQVRYLLLGSDPLIKPFYFFKAMQSITQTGYLFIWKKQLIYTVHFYTLWNIQLFLQVSCIKKHWKNPVLISQDWVFLTGWKLLFSPRRQKEIHHFLS